MLVRLLASVFAVVMCCCGLLAPVAGQAQAHEFASHPGAHAGSGCADESGVHSLSESPAEKAADAGELTEAPRGHVRTTAAAARPCGQGLAGLGPPYLEGLMRPPRAAQVIA